MAPRQRNNNAWLKRFMKERSLTRPQIATACAVNLSAVDRWLAPPRKVSHRKMPNMAVNLLMCMDQQNMLPSKKNDEKELTEGLTS